MIGKIFDRHGAFLIFFSTLIIYLLGISNYSTIDGWGYAADIVNSTMLFRPHHLLYSATGFVWVKIITYLIPYAEAIFLLKIFNALVASATILVLFKLLVKLNIDKRDAVIMSLFASVCWGFLRFAIENETYIVPTFLSLLASYFYLQARLDKRSILYILSGFFASLACLYHQIMFFWWLALAIPLLSRTNWKKFMVFTLPALIVPATYILIAAIEGVNLSAKSLIQFVLSDYYNGNATIEFSYKIIAIGLINTARTFIQLHGYIGNLLTSTWYWWIHVATTLLFVILSVKSVATKKLTLKLNDDFLRTHFIALLLQIAFAFLAGGNAEFMAMVPILFVIVTSKHKQIRSFFLYSTVALAIWNISFGVLPYKVYGRDSSDLVIGSIEKSGNERVAYLLSNAPKVVNRLEYYNLKAPIIIRYNEVSSQELLSSIDSLLSQGYTVYTNCINQPSVISRASLVSTTSKKVDFSRFNIHCIDSTQTPSGWVYLHKIEKR